MNTPWVLKNAFGCRILKGGSFIHSNLHERTNERGIEVSEAKFIGISIDRYVPPYLYVGRNVQPNMFDGTARRSEPDLSASRLPIKCALSEYNISLPNWPISRISLIWLNYTHGWYQMTFSYHERRFRKMRQFSFVFSSTFSCPPAPGANT